MRKAKVFVKGPGNGRESAIRTIHNNGIEVTEIFDVTPNRIMDVDHLKEEEFNFKKFLSKDRP